MTILLSFFVHGIVITPIAWYVAKLHTTGKGDGGNVLHVRLTKTPPRDEKKATRNRRQLPNTNRPDKSRKPVEQSSEPDSRASSPAADAGVFDDEPLVIPPDADVDLSAYLKSDAERYMEQLPAGKQPPPNDHGIELESYVDLQKKYGLDRPRAGLHQGFDPLTGSGRAELVFGNDSRVCFDISEPDPFDRHPENLWEFTRCD